MIASLVIARNPRTYRNARPEGNQRPPSLRAAHPADQEPCEEDTADLFPLYDDPAATLDRPRAVTDAEGTFRIPDTLIPVGETVTITDEAGAFVGGATAFDAVRVVAVRAGDPAPVSAETTIAYLRDGGNGEIRLTLP